MIRFGIAGTGRISDWVLKGALQDPRFKAVAVCSRSGQTASTFISKHPEAFDKDALVFTSIEEMARCPEVDAVYIGTPTSTHCAYTLACLEAGKHVLCEKPLACNAEEARSMIEASRRSGKCLMEAMISTLNPNFRAAVQKLRSLGQVLHYSSTFCQYSTKYSALKEGKVSNSFNPLMGGGALSDVGVYTTFPLVALFGKPDSVKADLRTLPTEFGDTDVHGTVELGYKAMTAQLSFSKAVDSFLPTEICGEDGNIVLDAIHICRKAEYIPHQAPASGRGPAAGRICLGEGLENDEYFYEFEEFINVVEAGGTESSVNTHDISLMNLELMDEIRSI